MNQFLLSLLPFVLPTLKTALASGAVWALTKMGTFFRAKAAEVNQSAAHAKALNALTHLDDLALNVVAHLNAEVKEKLPGFLESGTLTDEEKSHLKQMAVEELHANAPELMATLEELFSSGVELLLSGAVERAVASLNRGRLLSAKETGQRAAEKVQSIGDAVKVLAETGAPK